jgi:hypothetical protein
LLPFSLALAVVTTAIWWLMVVPRRTTAERQRLQSDNPNRTRTPSA